MVKQRIIWRDREEWARGTLGLFQKLESLVHGVEAGAGLTSG